MLALMMQHQIRNNHFQLCQFLKHILSIRNSEDFASVNILNPIDNQLKINLFLDRELKLNFELYTIDGRRIDSFSKDCESGETIIVHPFNYPSAFYLLKISDSENRVMVRKLIKR